MGVSVTYPIRVYRLYKALYIVPLWGMTEKYRHNGMIYGWIVYPVLRRVTGYDNRSVINDIRNVCYEIRRICWM